MFNLLIVDDEPLIVEGLAALDWRNVNIDQVYQATSGEKGLKVLEENQVDIIITDIKMPDMSGIEFLGEIALERQRKAILLSGYAEFEYAQQALKLKVFDYLLKPASDEELLDVVLRAGKALSQELENTKSYNELMKTFMPDNKHIGEVEPFHYLYENPQLIHLLDSGQWDLIEEKLNDIFTHLHLEKFQSNEFIIQTYFMISNSFIFYAHKNGHLLVDIIGSNFKIMFDAAQFGNMRTLELACFEVLEQLKSSIKKKSNSHHKSIIDHVQEYVEEHLGSDISLQSAAEHVYLHPAYLSKIYKLETAESFSDYIHRRRMEKAEDLLESTNEKVYGISKVLGYNDPSYFIRRFKSYYGLTPQEYRSKL